jgi:hypothetical protein
VAEEGEGKAGHGSFCIFGYLEMQRGISWLRLDQPGKAVAILALLTGFFVT